MDSTLTAGRLDTQPRTEARPRRPSPLPRRGRDDLWVTAGVMALIAATWAFSRLGLFTAESDTGYWLGVAGGVGMLLLFTYPMRKHLRFMQHWGSGRIWFIVHMVLGIAGPTLILLHSTFRIGSINAGVALLSMAVVAISGVVGRFLYVRIHRDMHGERLSLAELRETLGSDEGRLGSRLRFAPQVVDTLSRFEATWLVQGRPGVLQLLRIALWLPLARWQARKACRRELRIRLLAVARQEGWGRKDFRLRLRTARGAVDEVLERIARLAQFAAWERLFSLWHVAHVPFVYLMVISAIVHVVAVHAY